VAAGQPMTRIVRSLRNGQITIPIEFRRELGIGPDTLLQVTLDGDELRVTTLHTTGREPRSGWLKDLYEQFAPVRDEAKAYDESEINSAIDEAVRAVRAKHA
jgi:bifunctional DNA-binding transcriptional regulator/antitoxin component of YhaV-PrlF toxin-antitoxin module